MPRNRHKRKPVANEEPVLRSKILRDHFGSDEEFWNALKAMKPGDKMYISNAGQVRVGRWK